MRINYLVSFGFAPADVRRRAGRGFTLIELLVVIAIIGVLVAMLLPAVQAARESARRLHCSNQLKQIALSAHNFENARKVLPHGQYGDYPGGPPASCCNGAYEDSSSWSWLATLLPFLENDQVYRAGMIPKVALKDSTAIMQAMPGFLCPSDVVETPTLAVSSHYLRNVTVGLTNYKCVMGANWCWGTWPNARVNEPALASPQVDACDPWANGDGPIFPMAWKTKRKWKDFRDGASRTMMIGEQIFNRTRASCDAPCFGLGFAWAHAVEASAVAAIPINTLTSPTGTPYADDDYQHHNGFSSQHSGGAQFAFADGSVHFFTDTISLPLYRSLATIAGGEMLGEDY